MQLQLPEINVPPLAWQRATKNGSQDGGTPNPWLKVQALTAWVNGAGQFTCAMTPW